jgi:beta-glucosidase
MKNSPYYYQSFFCTLFILFFLTFNVFGQDKNEIIETKIDSIIKLLTLKEKIAMVHAQSKFSTPGVPRLGIPELWMSDGPHGVREEISWDNWRPAGWTNDSITAFPALTCLASTFNPQLSLQYGKSIGEEARYRKKDVLLGPGVNIYRTPLNGRNFEYMGEDPFLASQLVVPYIKGVQENGVAACVKHYVLNNQELWRGHINVEVSDRALHEIYLPAFKAAIEEGKAWAIMGAYNQFRGQYCCHNEILLNSILKKDWGFDGVVITDWGATHNTKEAAFNGLDIEMGTGTNGLTTSFNNAYDNYFMAKPMLKLIESGEIEESFLNDKVKRILRLMFRTSMHKNRPFGRANNKEHHEVARKIAQEGIVMLKNENEFFPIRDNQGITIAVIGENATRQMTKGGGSSALKPQFEISPLEGLKNRYKNAKIIHAKGYASGPPNYGAAIPSPLDANQLKKEALEAAKVADIVLFIGGLNKNHNQDCEGGDRLEFGLPFEQDNLLNAIIEVNKKVGVLLVSGNAVEIPWIDKVDALMQTWYIGSMSGVAIADIISGDVNPSGKLPFTFPKKLEDNAAHYFGKTSYPGDSINQYYKDDIFVGYRWHDTKKIAPLFEFGYGLSYTNFKISNISSNKKEYQENETIQVSCNLENNGDMDGSEVIQVYIGKPKSKVERATKELKGFYKTFVKKGEKNNVTIDIPISSLAYYEESISDWKIEKGDYLIYVGNSSQNINKQTKINVK